MPDLRFFAVAAPVPLFVAAAILPAAADTNVTDVAGARAQLDLVAAHQPGTYLGFLCILAAMVLIGCFAWLLGRSVPAGARGRLVARVGGGLVLAGGIAAGLANVVLGVLLTSAAQPGIDRDAAAAQLLATEQGSILAPFFIVYFLGLILGGLVLTAGLLLSRRYPWWLTLLTGASIVVLFFSGSGPKGVVTTLVMAAAFGLTAFGPWRRTQPAPAAAAPVPVDLAG